MTKSELIDALAERAGITREQAATAYEAIFSTSDGIIATALRSGDRVRLTGFGTFEARTRAARTGRNPRTGALIEIPETTVPVFRAGRRLKDIVGDTDWPGPRIR